MTASEPRERSAPTKRRARERVGEFEGRSPSSKSRADQPFPTSFAERGEGSLAAPFRFLQERPERRIAAHAEARRLDPNVPTSLDQTLLMAGEIERLLALEPPRVIAGADDGIRVIGLVMAGRRDEARQKLLAMSQSPRIATFQSWIEYLMAWLERRTADMAVRMSTFSALKIQDDPEAIFQEGWMLCDVGQHERGLGYLQRAVAKGYFAAATLSGRRQFDTLRGDPAFRALLEEAEGGRQRVLAAFREAGGERLIGS